MFFSQESGIIARFLRKKMKFSPLKNWPLAKASTQYVYLEGRTVEVNTSVLDWAESRKSESENSPETERLREAKQFAMGQIPALADQTMNEIGRHFSRPSHIENAKSIENLKDSVRSNVLNVLKQAPSTPGMTRPRWAGNYLQTILDIENDEHNAIETLQDTDRALQSITQLKEKYERQAKVLVDRKDSTDKAKKIFGNLFKNIGGAIGMNVEQERVGNTSEQYRFSEGNKVASQILADLEARIKLKQENAQEVFEDNKKHVTEGFELLSVEQKEIFIRYVEQELNGTNVLDVAPAWAKQIVFGVNFAQRVEIFKDLKLDPTAQKIAFEKESNLFDDIESELKIRRSALNSDLGVISPTNFRKFRKNLTGVNKDESFNPAESSDLKDFVLDLRTYLEREGDLGSNDILKRYPAGENLNSTEQIMAYLGYLNTDQTLFVKNRMAKGLKAKLITYLEHLENIDAPDEVDGQSQDFLDQRTIIQTRYKKAKTSIDAIDATDITKIDDAKYSEINTFIGQAKREKRVYENCIDEKHDLTDKEVDLLDKLYGEIDKIVQQFEALRSEWETQTQGFSQAEKELKEAEDKALDKKTEAENSKILAEKSIELLENTTIAAAEERLEKSETAYYTFMDGKDKLTPADKTRVRALEKEYRESAKALEGYQGQLSKQHQALLKATETEATAEALFTKANKAKTNFNSSKSSYDFSKTKKHFAETLAVLDEDIKDLDEYKKAKNATSTPEQIKRYILELSAKENNTQHRERLQALQARNLENLQSLPNGSSLGKIEFVKYLHGREISAHSALLGPKSRPLGPSTVIGKTADAVILYNSTVDQIVLVQKAKDSGTVEVLCLAAPSDFDPSKNLPLSYVPEKADYMGELTSISA